MILARKHTGTCRMKHSLQPYAHLSLSLSSHLLSEAPQVGARNTSSPKRPLCVHVSPSFLQCPSPLGAVLNLILFYVCGFLGLPLGGILGAKFGVKFPLLISVGLCALNLTLVALVMPETLPKDRRKSEVIHHVRRASLSICRLQLFLSLYSWARARARNVVSI